MTTFDDPDERARQVFTPIVRATLVIGALGLGVITPFIAINKVGAAILSLTVFAAAASAWICMRYNRARLGTAIIVGAFWTVQTVLLVLSQGGFIGSAYVFSTLLAGAALGVRAAMIVGGLGVAALAVTTALSLGGVSLPIMFPAPLAARASFAIVILIGAIWTLHVFIRRMENAFCDGGAGACGTASHRGEVQRRAADFEEAQRLAQSGSWEFDVATGVHHWSRQHFRIHGLDPDVDIAELSRHDRARAAGRTGQRSPRPFRASIRRPTTSVANIASIAHQAICA